MKNIININTSGEQLISSLNNGTNTLYINGSAIPSSDWIGSGSYSVIVAGHAVTIAKAPDNNGNIQLIRVSEYNYKLVKTSGMQPGMLDTIYPVGSVYFNVNSVDPSVLFGGTWQALSLSLSGVNAYKRIS